MRPNHLGIVDFSTVVYPFEKWLMRCAVAHEDKLLAWKMLQFLHHCRPPEAGWIFLVPRRSVRLTHRNVEGSCKNPEHKHEYADEDDRTSQEQSNRFFAKSPFP